MTHNFLWYHAKTMLFSSLDKRLLSFVIIKSYTEYKWLFYSTSEIKLQAIYDLLCAW